MKFSLPARKPFNFLSVVKSHAHIFNPVAYIQGAVLDVDGGAIRSL